MKHHVLALLALALPTASFAQGFPNIQRTPGELIAGPIAPEQGRTAIIAWHGNKIVSVPEPPGSQPGADVEIRVVDISDPANPQITVVPDTAFGFDAHGYFQSGPYLYTGPHCTLPSLGPCTGPGPNNVYADSFRIGGTGGVPIGTTGLFRASMETETGLPVGGINRSGTQSPWGANQWWSYGPTTGEGWFAKRRNVSDTIYDWANGGALTGPAIRARWDHLGQTGVIGFPFIMGNVLIYASDQTGSGVASYDISDPSNPVLLDVLKEENPGGYWPEVYGHYLFFPRRDGEGGAGSNAGFMVVDIEDPTDLRVVADRNLPGSNQYVTFQDEYAFMNFYKIDMRTFEVVLTLPIVPGLIDASQFALPVGNLVVTGGYGADGPGLSIFAHQAAPDTRSPFVLYHVPRADQTGYSTECPIVLSIPETLRTETIIDGSSLIVRPVGGSSIPTWHSFGEGKLLTVTPRTPLTPDTTYEVILTSAIQDAAGNGLEPYTFRFSTGAAIGGGNQSPTITSITATPAAAAPGAEVTIAWSGSDPEGGSVEYRVDFGDGTPRTAWGSATSAPHIYAEAGHFQSTVQARDAVGAVSARSRTVTVATPPTASNSTASSPVIFAFTGQRVITANADIDTVTAVSASTSAIQWEAPVAADPRSVALAEDGTIWVACHDGDAIDILNATTGALIERVTLPYGSAPAGVVAIPGGNAMLVTCEGNGGLRRFSTTTRAETGSLSLGPTPRAIAVNAAGTRALVTRFISGEDGGSVYDVSLAGSMTLTRTIPLRRDRARDGSASGRGVPNYLAGIRISPDGRHAWVVGKKDNNTRGAFTSALLPLGQDNTVRAQLMLIDLATNAEDINLRLDIDNSDSPSAVAFSPLGDYAFVALQGNAQVAVVDVFDFLRQESPGTIHTRWGSGIAPQGIAVDPTSGTVFANSLTDRTVTFMNAAEFLGSGSANVPTTAVSTATEERFHPDVVRGKSLFYNASDTRMSAEGYISCATCHVDGSHDGRTFDFTDRGEGFRNTTDLRGRSGVGHGAVHWSANFDEIQDFEIDIRDAFGGSGFIPDAQYTSVAASLGTPKAGLSVDLDALSAYVMSLGSATIPRSPFRNADGSLNESALRGQALFNSNNCASCHNPATDYTDRQRHDVGTLRASSGTRLGDPLDGIDTPTLPGLHATAPYFHNGTAATVEEVFTTSGGRLAQAETGILANGATAEDVPWTEMKEWHGTRFVNLDGAATLTFDDIVTTAGAGYVEVRYNSAYGPSTLGISVNGNSSTGALPQSPNEPSYFPNEWRTVRLPVTWQAGTNTITFRESGSFAQLFIDDILFVTPDDLARASAHVRGFTAPELADIATYLRSLDTHEALNPFAAVERDVPITLDGTDIITIPQASAELSLVYTISNTGPGPLNLGQFHVDSTPPGEITLVRTTVPHLLPGATAELELRVAPATTATAIIRAWSDSPNAPEIRWTLEATRASTVSGEMWIYY